MPRTALSAAAGVDLPGRIAGRFVGVVLELGTTRMQGDAQPILADPRAGQLFLGGGMAA